MTRPTADSASFNPNATTEDIVAAYRLLLKRAPDPGGLAGWERMAKTGLPLEVLVDRFISSPEYQSQHPTVDTSRAPISPVYLGGYHVCIRASESDFGQAIAVSREYEPHVVNVMRELLKEGDTVLDIGANVGCLALLSAKLVGPSGRVIAVEPNPDNYQLLYAGILVNGYDNVQVLPYAASDRRQIVSLAGGTSNTHVESASFDEKGIYAESLVLDEALKDLSSLHLVKIDIEGHEPLALKGATELLRKFRPYLITEFNPRCLQGMAGVEPILYLEQLSSLYSHLHVLTAFGDSLEFRTPNEVMNYWHKRDEELTKERRLSGGLLHFDIVGKP